jgi:Tfp pilus assembly protein FimT
MKNNKGITLIELTIIMSIVAILAMCAVPPIGKMLQIAQVKSATMLLEKSILTARANAITEDRQWQWVVAFDKTHNGRHYDYVIFRDPNGNFVLDTEPYNIDGISVNECADMLIATHLQRDVTMETDITAFCFRKSGMAKWTDTTNSVIFMHLKNDIREYTITVSQTGMIKTK